MIRLENLSKIYSTAEEAAVSDLNLEVKEGEINFILNTYN
jgi:energy-coupling factor transporter ATP-binding protein EcfA2